MPYSVASPILVELAACGAPPARLVTTLQWEVAQRITATHGAKDYGVLGLLLGLRYESGRLVQDTGLVLFSEPDVDSALPDAGAAG